jgi:predicted site-specific integrase-resolvase
MARNKEGPLRSPGEVAQVYGVSKRTVQRWCRDGLVEIERTPTGQLRLVVDAETGRALPREDE